MSLLAHSICSWHRPETQIPAIEPFRRASRCGTLQPCYGEKQKQASFLAPCPFHLLMAPPNHTPPLSLLAIEAFRLLGLILGGGANKSTGLGANKSKQPYYGEGLFAPPPKMGPRSGRKGWTCLHHPPRRAQEVAERPGLVCPAPRSGRQACGLVCPAPQELAGRTGLLCPAPQHGPKKWPKGLDLIAPPPKIGPKSGRKGLDLFSPPPKMGLRSGRKGLDLFARPPI